MKFFEIEIENFRQYSGKNKIIMSTDPQKNFTVIQGANGAGKSNFMNAITWCLYGDEIHYTSKEGKRKIINESVSSEMKTGAMEMVSVSIMIGNEKPEFKFQRRISFYKKENHVAEEKTEFLAYEITDDKGFCRNQNPDWLVEKVLVPKKLREFFFFDGEKMDSFFKSTKEVKSNVERIAQIDILNGMISNLKSLERSYNRSLSKVNPKYADLNERRMNLEEEKNQKEEDRKSVLIKKESLGQEITEIENFLKNNSDNMVKGLQGQRAMLEDSIKKITVELRNIKHAIKDLLSSKAPIVFGHKAICRTLEIISEETEKGTLPPEIKDVFLEDLLKKETCICGRSLEKGTDCWNSVNALLTKIVPNDIAMDAVSGRYTLEEMKLKINFETKYAELLTEESHLDKELINKNEKLKEISSALQNYDEKEIAAKEAKRTELTSERSTLDRRWGVLSNSIVNLEDQLKELETILIAEEKNARSHNQISKQIELTKEILNNILSIKEDIIEEVRRTLEEKTQEYFLNMIWKKDAFSAVKIVDYGDEYKISVLSKMGNPCLGDLSAGERQVLALSFTAALYEVSGFNTPVIIDTPLGRISDDPSERIAEALPNYLSTTQVTLLATDKEYSEAVRSRLKKSVGKEYRIDYDESTRTAKVKEYGI